MTASIHRLEAVVLHPVQISHRKVRSGTMRKQLPMLQCNVSLRDASLGTVGQLWRCLLSRCLSAVRDPCL